MGDHGSPLGVRSANGVRGHENCARVHRLGREYSAHAAHPPRLYATSAGLQVALVEKGALKTAGNASGTRTYLPAAKREACVRAESQSFLDRIFGGAAKPLLVHFAQNSKLTAEEVKELKKLLDQQLKG